MTASLTESWVDEVPLTTLDRSDLELWGECPCQAWLLQRTPVNDQSQALVVGIEVHDVLSRTLHGYLADPQIPYWELKRVLMEKEAIVARPDVQPYVIVALQAMATKWCQFITERSPSDILRYDGGEAEHSGQLAVDFPEHGVRMTSELDFLYAGESPEVLHEIDYKSGWKKHTIDSIANSFQFQCHALCVFEAYPDVRALGVRVWPCRESRPTFEVLFRRENQEQYNARISVALQQWVAAQVRPGEQPPTWPETDKCGLCPVSHLCPRLECQPGDAIESLEKLVVIEQAEALIRKQLIAVVKKMGSPIVTPAGDTFSKVGPKTDGTWKVSKAKAEAEVGVE